MLRQSIALLVAALSLSAQTVDRTKAPQTPPIPSYKLPPVSQSRLPNGLTVEVVEDSRFPLVTARLNFMAGSKFDPADAPGLAEAVASLLSEGTKTRNSRQISEETDAIGGALGASAGPDSLTVVGSSLSEDLSHMLDLVADITLNANFPPNEVNLYRQNRIQSLKQSRTQPSYLAAEKMAQVVYGTSPYAHIAPTPDSLQKLDPKTLGQYRDTWLAPNNATLILIGKLPARPELMALVTKYFGAWKQKTLPAAPKIEVPAAHRQIVLVDRPGSVQADIHVGRSAPIRTTSEFFPMTVTDKVLGGGTNSRMFTDIRERDGFAYDAHSEYSTNREAAMFSAVTQVRNEVIEPALKDVLEEMDKLGTAAVAAPELSNVKNYMSGLYLLRLETQDGLATQLNSMKTLGLPDNYLETYTTRVRSVEPDQIQAAAKKYLSTGQAAIVVVGDASKIGDALKKFGEVTVVKAN
ncbi:MAG TPA: pitrilysin family protein [Candidatus Sulfopaludibacter sp.]|jgi:zinc protease|nr:pitrilysin family protein [Candidatus Sulfopaludibacter sp.]